MRTDGVRLTRVAFSDQCADLALIEDALRVSGLQWTIVGPPRLTDKPLTGNFRTATDRNLRRGHFGIKSRPRPRHAGTP